MVFVCNGTMWPTEKCGYHGSFNTVICTFLKNETCDFCSGYQSGYYALA